MVETKIQTKPDTKREDPRASLREARKRRLRLIGGDRPATVKVYAANETLREVLRHPRGLICFRDKIDQPVEWPNDSFTHRRIMDGSVRTDGPGSGEAPPDDEKLNAREHAAARKERAKPKPAEPKQAEPKPAEQHHAEHHAEKKASNHKPPPPPEPQPEA